MAGLRHYPRAQVEAKQRPRRGEGSIPCERRVPVLAPSASEGSIPCERRVPVLAPSASEGYDEIVPPLAYFLTWTTYGTWLPGDTRGWVRRKDGAWHVEYRPEDPNRQVIARTLMKDSAVVLEDAQRKLVRDTLVACCRIRNWQLHAVNVRSNHVHLVVSAGDIAPEPVMTHVKAWASRKLNESAPTRNGRWWTRHGSTRYINSEDSLAAAIRYVNSQ